MSWTRRGVIAAAAALVVGKGVSEASEEVDVPDVELQSEENSRPLDATDIELTGTAVETFLYSEGDWDARGTVEGRNTGPRHYHVTVEAALMDHNGNQIGPLKTFSTGVEAGETFELTKKWRDGSSVEKDGDHLRINWVKVEGGGLILVESDKDIYGEEEQPAGDENE